MIGRAKSRGVLLAALVASLGSTPGLAAEVEVSIAVAGDRPDEAPFEIILVAEPADVGAAGGPEAATEYSLEPGRWMLDLPPDRAWRLRAQAPGYWGNEVEVDRGPPAEVVELWLWRAGFLRGAVSTTADEGLPAQVELHLEGDALASQAGEPLAATVRCPVIQEVWQCEVPAGKLDLIVAVDRFVPHHRSRVIVEPDEVRDLGMFELELGGSIGGRVELADGGVPSRECQIRLEASSGGRSDRGSLAEAGIESDGRFAFSAIPAGEYVLTASQAGYLPATRAAVEVLPGESKELPEPLVLRRPAALELVFSPPAAPEGRSWRFVIKELDPAEGRSAEIFRGESSPDGIWSKEDLVPGPYEISVTGNVRAGLAPRRVELPSGWTTVPIELPVVLVEGYVLAGGEPLAAKVTFSRLKEKLSTTFESDETGAFTGPLPREGRWRVQVEAPAEEISIRLDPIDVWALGGSGVAEVEIRLPDTVLEGQVTDMLGSPVPGARVDVAQGGRFAESRTFQTDAEGRFRIRGLKPGSISVMATAGGRRSQWVDLILYEDRPGPPLRIVVR